MSLLTGRVRRWGHPHPLPSEPYVRLSTHTAQASNNAPAWHDRARLRRPTTPLTGRGCPIGLGVNLDVTAIVPATEMVTVAGAAPAEVIATSPTDLLCPLRRLPDGSRPSTPGGSRPAFAR